MRSMYYLPRFSFLQKSEKGVEMGIQCWGGELGSSLGAGPWHPGLREAGRKPRQVQTAVSLAQRCGPSGPVTPVPGPRHRRRHLPLLR